MQNKQLINPFVVVKGMDGDDKAVEIEGLANRHEVDRYKEIIEADAWSKNGGLEDFYKNPIVLFNHDQDIPIGSVKNVEETKEGLKVRIQISKSDDPVTSRIRNLIQEGIIKSFSVGFRRVTEEKDGEITRIKEARLHEVSAVSIPVQQSSQFSVKGGPQRGGKKQLLIQALDELQRRSMEEPDQGNDDGEQSQDEKATADVKTTMDNGHSHTAEYNIDSGDGKTTGIQDGESQPHTHEIKNKKVLPAGEDEHTHTLIMEGGDEKGSDEEEGEEEGGEEEGTKKKSPFEESLEPGFSLQSVVYGMDSFTEEQAKAHADENGFKSDKIEIHPEFKMVVAVQRAVSEFDESTFDRKEIADGIVGIVGKLLNSSDESENANDDDESENAGADSGDSGENTDGEKSLKNKSEAINNETPDTSVGEQPHFEMLKQNNILLGQVIIELQKMNKAIEGLVLERNVEPGDENDQTGQDDALNDGKKLDIIDEDVVKIKQMTQTVTMINDYMKNINKEMSALGV